jgi:catechol 2,3-dioxygenase-like lactoylglutathione lyase family enzyme
VRGFDHVAVPMQNTESMVAFYRALGLQMNETPTAVSVYVGDQMINFHRPSRWQNPADTLRAPAARPPCGDFCFVWEGTLESLQATLKRAAATIELGPVERPGARRTNGTSLYVRDPDGNLLEFMIYR